jgi:hypothetical protein
VRDQDLSHPNLVAPATALLEGRDSDLAAAAAEVLGHQRGEPAPATVASLLRVARHGDRRASVAALTALADLKVPASELMPALGALLIDDDPEIARAAARIAATGAEPGPAPSTSPEFGPLVLEALVRGLVTCEDRLIAASADALRALGGLDQDSTRSAFRALDSELRRRVRGALDDMGEGT